MTQHHNSSGLVRIFSARALPFQTLDHSCLFRISRFIVSMAYRSLRSAGYVTRMASRSAVASPLSSLDLSAGSPCSAGHDEPRVCRMAAALTTRASPCSPTQTLSKLFPQRPSTVESPHVPKAGP